MGTFAFVVVMLLSLWVIRRVLETLTANIMEKQNAQDQLLEKILEKLENNLKH